MVTLIAATPGCPAEPPGLPPGWYRLLTLLLALCSIGLLLWIANGYSSPARRRAVISGRLVEIAGMSAALTGAVLISFFTHRDRCGQSVGAGTLGTWLLVVGLFGFAVGTLIRASTEWVSFAVVAIADLWLLAVLAWSQVAHRAAIAVILGTHALCSCFTVAWSRRTRAADQAIKAKASEAGRQLTAAWLIVALLYLASRGDPDGSALPETTVLNVFVIAAIVLVTGTGYTKYTEAMAAIGDRRRIGSPGCADYPPNDGGLNHPARSIPHWSARQPRRTGVFRWRQVHQRSIQAPGYGAPGRYSTRTTFKNRPSSASTRTLGSPASSASQDGPST